MSFDSGVLCCEEAAMSELLVGAYWPAVKEIAALFHEWDAALATADPHRVADRYAPDAVLLPTLSNEVRTDRAGIVDYFTRFLECRPRGAILRSHVRVLRSTEAVDSGTYRFTLMKDGVIDHVDARFTFVYEKIDGTWLIVNHHSSAMPES
jgi:uncharacterized protein (TIGR02246 family)